MLNYSIQAKHGNLYITNSYSFLLTHLSAYYRWTQHQMSVTELQHCIERDFKNYIDTFTNLDFPAYFNRAALQHLCVELNMSNQNVSR